MSTAKWQNIAGSKKIFNLNKYVLQSRLLLISKVVPNLSWIIPNPKLQVQCITSSVKSPLREQVLLLCLTKSGGALDLQNSRLQP